MAEGLEKLIFLGREHRNLEYKASVAWKDLEAEIAMTAMAMSNIRDGGTVVIGVDKAGLPTGVIP